MRNISFKRSIKAWNGIVPAASFCSPNVFVYVSLLLLPVLGGTWVRSKSTSSVSICRSLYNWFCLLSNSTSCWELVRQCLSSWHNLDKIHIRGCSGEFVTRVQSYKYTAKASSGPGVTTQSASPDPEVIVLMASCHHNYFWNHTESGCSLAASGCLSFLRKILSLTSFPPFF